MNRPCPIGKLRLAAHAMGNGLAAASKLRESAGMPPSKHTAARRPGALAHAMRLIAAGRWRNFCRICGLCTPLAAQAVCACGGAGALIGFSPSHVFFTYKECRPCGLNILRRVRPQRRCWQGVLIRAQITRQWWICAPARNKVMQKIWLNAKTMRVKHRVPAAMRQAVQSEAPFLVQSSVRSRARAPTAPIWRRWVPLRAVCLGRAAGQTPNKTLCAAAWWGADTMCSINASRFLNDEQSVACAALFYFLPCLMF